MSRAARKAKGGLHYYVSNAGYDGASLFHDYADARDMALILRETAAQRAVALKGWRLSSDLFEAVVAPPGDNDLGEWMRSVGTAYAARYRSRYGGAGHVWQARFRSVPVQEGRPLLMLGRHLGLDRRDEPTTGGELSHPGWPWRGAESALADGLSGFPPLTAGQARFVAHSIDTACPLGEPDWVEPLALQVLGWTPPKRPGRPKRAEA